MTDRCGSGGARPQPVAALPLELHQVLPAMLFDSLRVRRPEHLLPGKAWTDPVVAHIRDAMPAEAFPDRRIHPLVNLAAVDDRGFTTARRRTHTAEPDL